MAATTVLIYMIEAFTVGNNIPYTGNPAAVVFLQYDNDISDDIKQKIANTMSVSETAFVSLDWTRDSKALQNSSNKNGTIKRALRWFTPISEIDICGHATVGSAKAILDLLSETEPDGFPLSRIDFDTKFQGILPVEITAANNALRLRGNQNIKESDDDTFALNFPTAGMREIPLISQKPGYWLGTYIRNVLGPLFPFDGENISKVVEDVQLVENGALILIQLKRVVNELPETTVKKVTPNIQKLLDPINEDGIGLPHGVVVTIKGDDGGPHCYSRVFVPFYGIDEDPVNGYAHTALTPYWLKELDLERDAVVWARQASARGGDLYCQLVDDSGTRVFLGGKARIVFKAELNV